MALYRLLAVAGALACGCGGAGPRPAKPDTTYYWTICDSTVEFSADCSDEPAFREANGPLLFEPGSHLIYKTSADARSATLLACTSYDPSSCKQASSGVVFQVAGAELSYAAEQRATTGFGACMLTSSWSWLLTDLGTSLDVAISSTLSLSDDPAACEQVEATARRRAPNMKGVQGCTVTFRLRTVSPDKNC